MSPAHIGGARPDHGDSHSHRMHAASSNDGDSHIDGVVLAGGTSSRMQQGDMSRDKAWMLLDGIALIEHVARSLAPQVTALYVSTNGYPDRYQAIGATVQDQSDDRRGPLAGVLAAMAVSTAPWLAVAPCDCPFLPPGWVARLYRAACDAQAPLAVVSQHGLRQPVCMVVRTDLHEHLHASLSRGVRKVGQWQREVGAIPVPFDDVPDHAFLNINTPDELVQAHRISKRSA